MTYKDALMKIVKSDDVKYVIDEACPADKPNFNCPKYADDNQEMTCIECWNREMPEVEDHEPGC